MALSAIRLGLGAFAKGSKGISDKVLMSGLGRTFTGLPKGVKPRPSDTALLGLPAALAVGPPILSGLGEAGESLLIDPLKAVSDEERFNRSTELYRLRKERLLRKEFFNMQVKMQEAVRQLAFYSPQKYQELLAGRKLPQDAIVIGGSPRAALLQQFATDAAMGQQARPNLEMEPDPLQEIGL